MTKTESGTPIILKPDVAFGALENRLKDAGWTRRSVAQATRTILPGEPELALWQWDADDTRLTYTFNPVVHLRVLRLTGESAEAHHDRLAQTLPTLDLSAIEQALKADDARHVLRGILAAAEIETLHLAGPIGLLAGHPEPAVAQAAARVHLDLLHLKATALAQTELSPELAATLQSICGNALPLLAALPGASPDEVLGLQPTEEDCDAVFQNNMATAVFEAYDALWLHPPKIAPGPDRHELRVHACPAALFGSDNAFSYAFPGGYRGLSPHLRPGRVWVAWRYCRPGNETGLAFDGLVHVRGNWVWFPKPYQVVGRIIRQQ